MPSTAYSDLNSLTNFNLFKPSREGIGDTHSAVSYISYDGIN